MIKQQNKIRILFLLSLILFPVLNYGQELSKVKKSNSKVIIEGNVYFIHVVKPGHTLYAISKAYEVTEKDIALENPGVYSGLQIGQVLKIPAEVSRVKQSVAEVDTIRFIRHILKEGETFYQLSKMYNVPASEIENVNSGLDYTNLSVGQQILIPRPAFVKNEDSFYYHKVRRRETLFSLSRQYDTDKRTIKKFNPELEIRGLKTGQIVRIPKTKIEEEQQKINDVPFDSMTLVEGDSLLIDIDNQGVSLDNYSRSLKKFNRNKLKVAYLIPFDYYEAPVSDSIKKLEALNKISSEEERRKQLPKSMNFLEFFEGSMLAFEDLDKEGYNLEVKYYDTRKSPSHVREILESDFMTDVDLIIGPFFSWNVEIVNEYSKAHGIPFIPPFYENEDLTSKNPFLFQTNPSYKTEFKVAAKILAKDYDKNFLFVYSKDSMKIHEVDYLKVSTLEALRTYTHEENVVFKELVYENAAKSNISADLDHALSKDKKNIVVIPESNEAFVSNLITQLYFKLGKFDIEVFGMPHFGVFLNTEYDYYHALNLKYLSAYYYSYSDSSINVFLDRYKLKYGSEPVNSTRKGCNYAFSGYDISYYFGKTISEYQNKFVDHLSEINSSNILIPMKFHKQSVYGGFENHYLQLIEYRKDLSIKTLDESELFKKPVESKPVESKPPWFSGFEF